MSKILFNEHQRRLLEANPNVNSVSDRSIQYKPEFKVLAVKVNQSGKGPSQVFIENGFDLEMIGTKKAKESLSRWRKSYQLHVILRYGIIVFTPIVDKCGEAFVFRLRSYR